MLAMEASILFSISAEFGCSICPNESGLKIVDRASKAAKVAQVLFETARSPQCAGPIDAAVSGADSLETEITKFSWNRFVHGRASQ